MAEPFDEVLSLHRDVIPRPLKTYAEKQLVSEMVRLQFDNWLPFYFRYSGIVLSILGAAFPSGRIPPADLLGMVNWVMDASFEISTYYSQTQYHRYYLSTLPVSQRIEIRDSMPVLSYLSGEIEILTEQQYSLLSSMTEDQWMFIKLLCRSKSKPKWNIVQQPIDTSEFSSLLPLAEADEQPFWILNHNLAIYVQMPHRYQEYYYRGGRMFGDELGVQYQMLLEAKSLGMMGVKNYVKGVAAHLGKVIHQLIYSPQHTAIDKQLNLPESVTAASVELRGLAEGLWAGASLKTVKIEYDRMLSYGGELYDTYLAASTVLSYWVLVEVAFNYCKKLGLEYDPEMSVMDNVLEMWSDASMPIQLIKSIDMATGLGVDTVTAFLHEAEMLQNLRDELELALIGEKDTLLLGSPLDIPEHEKQRRIIETIGRILRFEHGKVVEVFQRFLLTFARVIENEILADVGANRYTEVTIPGRDESSRCDMVVVPDGLDLEGLTPDEFWRALSGHEVDIVEIKNGTTFPKKQLNGYLQLLRCNYPDVIIRNVYWLPISGVRWELKRVNPRLNWTGEC